MHSDHHERFQRMIGESLAGVLSAEKEQSLRDHLSACTSCNGYLSASNRVIAGLGGFFFEVDPALNARIVADLRTQIEQTGEIPARPSAVMQQHKVTYYKGAYMHWAAFAVALSMSVIGSAIVYRVARLLMAPMHFDMAQVEAGVVLFWLLPSVCAAFYLLAALGGKRGIA